MLTEDQLKGNVEYYHTLTLEMINDALKRMFLEEELNPYKDLGNGLYELPGYIIANKKGLEEYLKKLGDETDKL